MLVLYYAGNMTGPKILELLAAVGMYLSKGQMSNFLIKKHHRFQHEKAAVYEAELGSSPWQHVDETGTRVNGQNQHCHIVCNPLYTAYFTTEKKDRLMVLDVLRNFRERRYRLNEEAYRLLAVFKLPAGEVRSLRGLPQEVELSEGNFSIGWRGRFLIWDRTSGGGCWRRLEWPPTMRNWSFRWWSW